MGRNCDLHGPRHGARRGTLRRWLAAAAALTAIALAGPASAEGVLLRVEGDVGQAWLLGSLHFGSSDLYPLSEPVERAFAASDRLMVEVNLLALRPEAVVRTIESLGSYPEGDGLRQRLPEALWQRLFRAARDLDLPVKHFERQRPWRAAVTLTATLLERHGLTPALGVDQHFLRRASRAGLPILELESFAAQMELLAGIPEDEQVLMLEETLAQMEAKDSLPMDVLQAWRRGDEAALERLLVDGIGSGERGQALTRRLLASRNDPMAARLDAELARGGTVFVVVGTAHLLGRDSMADALRRRGLRVTAF